MGEYEFIVYARQLFDEEGNTVYGGDRNDMEVKFHETTKLIGVDFY